MSEPIDIDPVESRGVKRKADVAVPVPARIKQLDESVINLIAAGEIIVAPVNALKEMIENSVDAGATSIDIIAVDGGLKMLQIQDNGCGIDRVDLPLLCVRHATSKLQAFEDLRTLETYGFRGEALASISHIAHVKVTTKTKDSTFAWTARYDGPQLSGEPTKSAGVQGTRITVEDLFYNVPTRRRAFRSGNDEFQKIVDMVSRYAVHCWQVAFVCKKVDGKGAARPVISVPANASILDRIRTIYSSAIANELMEFSAGEERYKFKATGWASNANYSVKRMQFVLFINNRSVESSNLKKTLEQTYAAFLPKGGHPWIYLSIHIDPRNLDVNIHPTKKEVNFLYEDEIIQCICEKLRSKMASVDSSRTFLTQTLLPGAATPDTSAPTAGATGATGASGASGSRSRTSSRKEPPASAVRVRTDASARKITSMFATIEATAEGDSSAQKLGAQSMATAVPGTVIPAQHPAMPTYEVTDAQETVIGLHSVKTLRKAVRSSMHVAGTELVGTLVFVGVLCARKRIAMIQSGLRLYMVDYGRLAVDLFYQLGLTNFANFGVVRLRPSLAMLGLVRRAAAFEAAMDPALCDDPAYDPDAVAQAVVDRLIERREMLMDYFAMKIAPTGELVSLPLMLKGYSPSLARVPQFLLHLGNINWHDERACFHTFLLELARFHAPEALPAHMTPGAGAVGGVPKLADVTSRTTESASGDAMDVDSPEELIDKAKEPATERSQAQKLLEIRQRHVLYALEHVIFPTMRDRMIVTQEAMRTAITEVADLRQLYRTFERC